MPTFFARRYGRSREQVSKTEKAIGAVVLVVLAGLGVAFGRALTVRTEGVGQIDASTAAESPAGRLPDTGGGAKSVAYQAFDLPKLAKDGWAGPADVQSFTPDNVHEKINGRASLYIDYGLVGMTFGTYRHGKNEDRYVDVYVYHQGETLNAFGCYKAEFAEGMPAIKTGRGGYRAEQSLFFWKGAQYVQLMTGDAVTDADADVLAGLAEQIAARISDNGAPLWGDQILPEAGRSPSGLGYERVNGFSLDFLREIFRSDYRDGDKVYTLFIHRAASPEAARALLEKYAAYLTKHGKLISRQDSPQGQTITGEALEMFDVVFCKGPLVGGVNGAEDLKVAQKHAVAFRDELQ